MYLKHKSKGFLILGFPSNEFGNEPGTDEEIKLWYEKNYKVTFPILAKVRVNGIEACPVFNHITQTKD